MHHVKLYHLPYRYELNLTGGEILRVNPPMNRYDTKIHKGNDNHIEFQVRDSDRKPINLSQSEVLVRITSTETNEWILEKPANITVPLRGLARFTLTADEIENLAVGPYTYSVRLIDGEGISNWLYTNQTFQVTGHFEIYNEAQPYPSPSTTINEFWPLDLVDDPDTFVSGAFSGAAYLNFTNNLHTYVVYLTAFTGSVTLQGTLNSNVPLLDEDWFEINTETYDDSSGLFYYNFEYNPTFVRVKYTKNPLYPDGSVDQVLLRN